MLTIPRQVISRPKSGRLYQNLTQIMQTAYGAGYTATIRSAHFHQGSLSFLEVLDPQSRQVVMHRAPDYKPLVYCNQTVHFID